jgi:hypothetical protein
LQQRWARMPRNLAARMNENTISALAGVVSQTKSNL